MAQHDNGGKDRAVSVIHPWAVLMATNVADGDAEFIKIEQYLDTLTFDASDVPHYVEWGPLDDVEDAAEGTRAKVLFKPEMFNCDDFRHKFRTVAKRARVHSRRLKFAPMWVLDEKRMANYLKDYLLADAYGRAELPAPFGVIEPDSGIYLNNRLQGSELAGAGSRIPITRLEAEWTPAAAISPDTRQPRLAEGVKTFVIPDAELSFNYPNREFSVAMIERVRREGVQAPVLAHIAERFGTSSFRGTGLRGANGVTFVLPRTALFDVIEQRDRLQEARANHMQAEGTAIQPHIIVNKASLKIPKEARDNLTDEARAFGAELDYVIGEQQVLQRYTYGEWQARVDALNRAIRPPNLFPGGGESTPSSQIQRIRYDRPHPHENNLDLPEGVTLAHVHKPEVFTDIEKLTADYRLSVAECLGLGLSVLERFAQGGRGVGSSSTDSSFSTIFSPQRSSDEERHIQHVIQTERNWMANFFNILYGQMMNALDLRMLEDIYNSLHTQRINMKEAKLAARALEAALTKEMQLVDQPDVMTKFKEVVAVAKTKGARKAVRQSIVYYRNLIDRLRARPDATARLVFQPGMTERSARQCQILLEAFYDRGLIDAKQIVPFAQAVFGKELKLNTTDPVSPEQRDQVELANLKADADLKRARETAKAKGPPAKKARKK